MTKFAANDTKIEKKKNWREKRAQQQKRRHSFTSNFKFQRKMTQNYVRAAKGARQGCEARERQKEVLIRQRGTRQKKKAKIREDEQEERCIVQS